MLNALKKVLFGSYSDKELKKYSRPVALINQLEPEISALTQAKVLERMAKLRERAQQGEDLNQLLPECFALVRKAAQETLGQRPYDVQLMGGIALHNGEIAEMKTGEGKTLTATLPLVLNALPGKGAHCITVNDYLAKRDSDWMKPIYEYLGFSVGVILHNLDDAQRRQAYAADITYGTNNEFGFDYLRDNMKFHLDHYVQREHHFAIVDEVDSILIDEARTPLIISGPAETSTDLYAKIDRQIHSLTRGYRLSDGPDPSAVAKANNISEEEVKSFLVGKEDFTLIVPGDFTLDEKSRNIQLTDQGVEKMQERVKSLMKSENLYDFENIEVLHHVNQALKAHYIFKRDVDYVVQNNKVVLVDEFTGRLMEGRRFSDGLHQALEAKENVRIENENQTLASITFQNYFRKYSKLAGMTGTAETEAEEFRKIYNLGVVVVPTNVPVRRKDNADLIFKTRAAKFRAIIRQVQTCYEKQQPVLVGTVSIESSEYLSAQLKKAGVPHQVLNAKYHEQEAQIIANAGKAGAVTIATNMAGRGTDIKVAKPELEKGGLFILGTERHESRRIDNQLRGRSGRQGDWGESRFFLSLEDDLLRIFGGERIANLMGRLNIDEDEAIEHILITKAIENSQKKVEAYNFEIRKHLLEYDDVMNRQREIIYRQRRRILGSEGEEVFKDMMEDYIDQLLKLYCHDRQLDEWDLEGLFGEIFNSFGVKIQYNGESHGEEDLQDFIIAELRQTYENKCKEFGPFKESLFRQLLLEMTDGAWKDHLLTMDHLKEGIGMRGYAQKNPLNEYKKEGFQLFTEMLDRIGIDCIRAFFHVKVVQEPPQRERQPQPMEMIHHQPQTALQAPPAAPEMEAPKHQPAKKRTAPGRNDLCYCGSGKKYKNCHMKDDQDHA